jgi:hypothetical protein
MGTDKFEKVLVQKYAREFDKPLLKRLDSGVEKFIILLIDNVKIKALHTLLPILYCLMFVLGSIITAIVFYISKLRLEISDTLFFGILYLCAGVTAIFLIIAIIFVALRSKSMKIIRELLKDCISYFIKVDGKTLKNEIKDIAENLIYSTTNFLMISHSRSTTSLSIDLLKELRNKLK